MKTVFFRYDEFESTNKIDENVILNKCTCEIMCTSLIMKNMLNTKDNGQKQNKISDSMRENEAIKEIESMLEQREKSDETNCKRKVSVIIDEEMIFKDKIIQKEDTDMFPSIEAMCQTKIDPVAMLKSKPKMSSLKKISIKSKNTKNEKKFPFPTCYQSFENHDSSEEEIGLYTEELETITHAFDGRRKSCFSWTGFKQEKKKDSLTSESEVFEIVHIDSSGRVSKKEQLLTGTCRKINVL